MLAFLAVREVTVPEDVRTRITECEDPDQLESWIRRAATARSVHDLFE